MAKPDRLPNPQETATLIGLFNGVAPGLVPILVHRDLPLSVHNQLFKNLRLALNTAIDATETTTMGGGYRQRRRSQKNRKPYKARKSRRN